MAPNLVAVVEPVALLFAHNPVIGDSILVGNDTVVPLIP